MVDNKEWFFVELLRQTDFMMCADTAEFAISLSVVLVRVCYFSKSPQSQLDGRFADQC